MTRRTLLEELTKLSAAERLLLAQDLWDSVAADSESMALSATHRRALMRRLRGLQDRSQKGQAAGASSKEAKARIRRSA